MVLFIPNLQNIFIYSAPTKQMRKSPLIICTNSHHPQPPSHDPESINRTPQDKLDSVSSFSSFSVSLFPTSISMERERKPGTEVFNGLFETPIFHVYCLDPRRKLLTIRKFQPHVQKLDESAGKTLFVSVSIAAEFPSNNFMQKT